MALPDLSPELHYRATRGSGPGGQHVNKVSTRVELRWSLRDTTRFDERERARLAAKLAARLTLDGELVLSDHSTRSQAQNRAAVTARLYALLAAALAVDKPRRATRPTAAARAKRLRGKRHRAHVKAGRGPVDRD